MDERFSDRFEFLPTRPDGRGFFWGDLIVRSRSGNDGQKIGKLLHNFIGSRNQKFGVGTGGFRVLDEKPAGALTDPLHDSQVPGAAMQRFNAVKGVSGPTAGGLVGRFAPLVNHGERESEVGGGLLRAPFLKDFPQQLVGLHAAKLLNSTHNGKWELSARGLTRRDRVGHRLNRNFTHPLRHSKTSLFRRWFSRLHTVPFVGPLRLG